MNSFDPTDLHGQDRTKADNDQRNKLARETEEADFKWLMGSTRGRRIVWGLLERAGVFRLSFSTNALQMAFNEGSRNEGNRLLAQINTICPEHYLSMTKEQANGSRNDDADR